MVNQQPAHANVDGPAIHPANHAAAALIGEFLHLGQALLVFADDLLEHPGQRPAYLPHQSGSGHNGLLGYRLAAKGFDAAQHHGASGEELARIGDNRVYIAKALHSLIAHCHAAGPAGGFAHAADRQVDGQHVARRHAGAAGCGKGADGRRYAAGNQQAGHAQSQGGHQPQGSQHLGRGLRGVRLIRELQKAPEETGLALESDKRFFGHAVLGHFQGGVVVVKHPHRVFLLPRGDEPEVAVDAPHHGEFSSGVGQQQGGNHRRVEVQSAGHQLVLEEHRAQGLDHRGQGGGGHRAVCVGLGRKQRLEPAEHGFITDANGHRKEHQIEDYIGQGPAARAVLNGEPAAAHQADQSQQHGAHTADHHPHGDFPHFAPQLVGHGPGVVGPGVVLKGLLALFRGEGRWLRLFGLFRPGRSRALAGSLFQLFGFFHALQGLGLSQQGGLQHVRVDDMGGQVPGAVLEDALHIGDFLYRPGGRRFGQRLGGLRPGVPLHHGDDHGFLLGGLGLIRLGGFYIDGSLTRLPSGRRGLLIDRRLGLIRLGGFYIDRPLVRLPSGRRSLLVDRRLGLQRDGGQNAVHGFFADRLAVPHLLQLNGAVEHIQLDLHGLAGGLKHGLLQLVRSLAAFYLKAVLAGVRVGGKGRHRHGSRYPEFFRYLLLVQSGALNGLGYPAAALLLQKLKIFLHLVVNGLGVIEQGLIALFPQRRGVSVHAVLIQRLKLDAVIHVVFVLVKIRHLFPPIKQAPALFFLLFGFFPLFRFRRLLLRRSGGEGLRRFLIGGLSGIFRDVCGRLGRWLRRELRFILRPCGRGRLPSGSGLFPFQTLFF